MPKLYLPSTQDTVLPTLPSRWSNALFAVAGSDGSGTSYGNGLVDNKVLPFYRLSTTPQTTKGTIPMGISGETIAGTGLINVLYKQILVAGYPVWGSGTFNSYAAFYQSFLAGSASSKTCNWGGSYIRRMGLLVPFIYVYRPSTATVIGSLAAIPNGTNLRYVHGYCSNTVGFSGSATSTYAWVDCMNMSVMRTRWSTADVAVQDGDMVCYEVWYCQGSETGNTAPVSSMNLECGWSGIAANGDPYWTGSGTAATKSTFFYWDDVPNTAPTVPSMLPATPTPPPVFVTDASPGVDGAGASKVTLTFDRTVAVSSPTIGPKAGGVAVSGLTTPSSQVLDVGLIHTQPAPLVGGSTHDEVPAVHGGAMPT